LALSLTGDLRVIAADLDACDGFRSIEAARPDLIVADYRLRGSESGIDLATRVRDAEKLRADGSLVPIVLLTAFPAPAVARQASTLEQVSVLSKQSAVTEIVSALRRAVMGICSESAVVSDPFSLSPAEMEVLEFLAAGMTATMIAEQLCLSVHAIRARIRGLLNKTHSTSQLEAVTKATRAGLVVPPSFDGPAFALASA
jgi:DNA-binding NarL/FixJ family response regulator